MDRAEERRVERLAALAEDQRQAFLVEPSPEEAPFVFVAPRVEMESSDRSSPNAMLSDRDRIGQSPTVVPDARNRLPVADGNSSEFVVNDDESAIAFFKLSNDLSRRLYFLRGRAEGFV